MRNEAGRKRRLGVVLAVVATVIVGLFVVGTLTIVRVAGGQGHVATHSTDFESISELMPGLDEDAVVSVSCEKELWDNGFAPNDYCVYGTFKVDDVTAGDWLDRYDWKEDVPTIEFGGLEQDNLAQYMESSSVWMSSESLIEEVGTEGFQRHGGIWFDGKNTVLFLYQSM